MVRASWLTLFVVALTAGNAVAQTPATPQAPLRLAYINSQVILANTPGRAAAESLFAREMTGYRAEVGRLQAQLDSGVAEYQRTQVVMTPQARQAREGQLRDMEARVRARAQELDSVATNREAELSAPIMARVNAVIEGIRAELQISMIFDAAGGGGLITADRSLDISALVIQRLQANPPPGPTPSPAGAPADTTRRPAAGAPLRPRRP